MKDLAGNPIFYSNDPNLAIANIDPFKDWVNDDPRVQIDPESNEVVNGNNGLPSCGTSPEPCSNGVVPLPEDYPYSTENREKSLDFRLFIDNLKPGKEEFILDGWADKIDGIKADGLVPEYDRILTDNSWPLDEECKPGVPAHESPNCPVSPVYVIRNNQITFKARGERYQRVVLEKTGIDSGGNSSYEEFEVGSNNCIFPEGEYNNVERGGIITKYAQECEWTHTFIFTDNGLSPLGVPQNWYRFSFYILDLAGNTPVKENDTIYARSFTIYHDTDNPDDTQITNIKSLSYNPVKDYPNRSITKDTSIISSLFAEPQADIEHSLIRTINTKTKEVIELCLDLDCHLELNQEGINKTNIINNLGSKPNGVLAQVNNLPKTAFREKFVD